MANEFGNSVADYRMKVVGPRAAKLKAMQAQEEALRKEAAGMAPDFAELSELMIKDPMHDTDLKADVARLNALQSNFLRESRKDPFLMFSPEGLQIAKQVRNFKNDPNRQRNIAAYKSNLKVMEKVDKDGIALDPYVVRGQIQKDGEGKSVTVGQMFKHIDENVGKGANFSVSQSVGDEAVTRLSAVLGSTGENANTTYSEYDGAKIGLEPGSTIMKTIRTSNATQIRKMLDGMLGQGMIAGGDWDALLSRATSSLMATGKYDPKTIQHDAEEKAIDYIKLMAEGKTSELIKTSLVSSGKLNGGGSNRPEKIGSAADQLFSQSLQIVNADQGEASFGTGSLLPTNQLVGDFGQGTSLIGTNKMLSSAGLSARNIYAEGMGQSIRASGENKVDGGFTAEEGKHILENAIISGEGLKMFKWWATTDNRQASKEDVRKIQRINKLNFNNADKAAAMKEAGFEGWQERLFGSIEAEMALEDDEWLRSEYDTDIGNKIKLLPGTKVHKMSEEDAKEYLKKTKGVNESRIEKDSERLSFQLTFLANPNFDVDTVNNLATDANTGNVSPGTNNVGASGTQAKSGVLSYFD
jgi:hypothetical protein